MLGLDSVSNRLTRTDREYQYTFTYDATYRVTQSQPSLTVPNPVFQQTTETFTYDAVGNRLTGPGYTKANTFTHSYQYDYENRITSITKQVTGDPNTDTVTFKYDPFGRRIEKNVSTYEGGIPTTYKYTYVYDNEDIILEIEDKTQSGNTITTATAYIHGPGIDEPLSLERNGQRYYYHADGLGSITSITDASQAVVNRYAYDSFGAIKKSETIRNAYAFTGREFDSETGLYYYRARYYDPEMGRFVSKDPIGFAGGDVNVFGYVGNGPATWVDAWGLATEVIIWQPVGWGASSFGHVSVNIDDTTYSFGPNGYSIMPTSDYLNKNSFRDGVGNKLSLTPFQEIRLQACLAKDQGGYNTILNNCGSPIQRCLDEIGINLGRNILPVSLGNSLIDYSGLVTSFKFYYSTESGDGSSGPWAK